MIRFRRLFQFALLALVCALVGVAFARQAPARAQRALAPARQPAVTCPTGAPAVGKPLATTNVADAITYVDAIPLWRNINPKAVPDPATVMYQFAKGETANTYIGDASDACTGNEVLYVEFLAKKTVGPGRESFVFAGPAGETATYPVGFEVFITGSGNLLVAGGKTCQQSGLIPSAGSPTLEIPCH